MPHGQGVDVGPLHAVRPIGAEATIPQASRVPLERWTSRQRRSVTIRTKLFIGYLVFTATLVVLGGWSAWHLREMGGVSRNIIANNYDSTVAAHDMRDGLERQSS